MAREAPALHLLMAGMEDEVGLEGRLKERVRVLGLAHRVTWAGQIEEGLKWGAFLASTAFILPSHQENFGLAVAEALACGVPVLISNKVNIWHEIDAGGAGIVEDDDLAGTVRLLRRWNALGADGQEAMRRRAGDCFANHFRIERVAESLVGTLRRGTVSSS